MKTHASLPCAVGVGLMMFFACQPMHAQELLVNPGFETGDFSGWTLAGNPGFINVVINPVHSGHFAASFGSIGSETLLSQDIPTTPGGGYNVRFFLQNSGGPQNQFTVWANGNILFDMLNVPLQDFTGQLFTFQATTASTTLTFGFRNDPAFFAFDDASVTPIPTPEPGGVSLLAGLVSACGAGLWRKRRSATRPMTGAALR